jgi:hydroxymethylpyrimidine pyrophosphatase-like HAD family hydrolase
MRIYCDIDGTLTNEPYKKWGKPRLDMIKKVKKAIEDGHWLILWSAGGTKYAKKFAEKYDIKATLCIGKPHMIIDDHPDIGPRRVSGVLSPDDFLKDKDI